MKTVKSLFPPMAALFTRADRAVRSIRPMALKMMTSTNFKIIVSFSPGTMMAIENPLIKFKESPGWGECSFDRHCPRDLSRSDMTHDN